MFVSPGALPIFLTLVLPVSDNVPTLNVEPSCRAAAKMGDSLDATLRTCMNDESSAHAELQKQWSQFPAGDRQRCVAETSLGDPSYVEVLECLLTARGAEKIEKESGTPRR